jgi:hypothetical protein
MNQPEHGLQTLCQRMSFLANAPRESATVSLSAA